jgi:hypothetical protein
VEYLGVSSGCGRDASAPEGCDRPCLCSSRAIGRRVLGFGLDHVADDAASRLGRGGLLTTTAIYAMRAKYIMLERGASLMPLTRDFG